MKGEQMKREEIDKQYTWAIEEMIEKMPLHKAIEQIKSDCNRLKSYFGRLTDADTVLEALQLSTDISMNVENIIAYSYMKLSEDTKNSKSQTDNQLVSQTSTYFSESSSFIEPQLLELGENFIQSLIDDPRFADYDMRLTEMLRAKEHILSEKEEYILASISEVMDASSDIYEMLSDADMEFGELTVDGKTIKLTHSNYALLLEHSDFEVRKNAFELMYRAFQSHENSIAAMFATNIKSSNVIAKLRHYKDSLDMELFADHLPRDVYFNLIEVTREHANLLRKFVELKKRSHNMREFHIYDIYLPFTPSMDKKIRFDEAFDTIVEALQPLGEEYHSILKNAKAERWMDVYENEGKSSGAYSYGSYQSKPFILLNYMDRYDDMSTVAHELGHSMHRYLSREHQPYTKYGHSIFVAEVASTVNEVLLLRHLLKTASDEQQRKFLIGNFLEQFKSTFFRQVMFADFEAQVHKSFSDANPLGIEDFNRIYYDLNKSYFGDALILDDLIKYEWTRISHFYSPFYVFTYATSYCAAIAIANKILKGDEATLNGYINMLKAGESLYPLDILKLAGIDMETKQPIESALHVFEELLKEYEALL